MRGDVACVPSEPALTHCGWLSPLPGFRVQLPCGVHGFSEAMKEPAALSRFTIKERHSVLREASMLRRRNLSHCGERASASWNYEGKLLI